MTADPPLEIPSDLHDEMVAHCLREAPLECCGILGGISSFVFSAVSGLAVPLECRGMPGGVAPKVSSIHPLRNIAASETRYDADPRDLITAVRSLREYGAEILAIYHSHPRWAPIPSKTDLAENHYGPVPRIIVSLLGDSPEVRVWRLDSDSFYELPWQIVAPDNPASEA